MCIFHLLIENWYTRSRRDSVLAIVKLAPPEVRDMSAKDAAIRLRELMGEVPDAREVSVNYTLQNNDPDFDESRLRDDRDPSETVYCPEGLRHMELACTLHQ